MLAPETSQLQSRPWGELAGTILRPHQTVQRTSLGLQGESLPSRVWKPSSWGHQGWQTVTPLLVWSFHPLG